MRNTGLYLAAAMACAGATSAQAVTLANDGMWQSFSVDEMLNPSLSWIDDGGNALGFDFTLSSAARLRVVDAGWGGDRFQITINGVAHETSTVATPDVMGPPEAPIVADFDAAFADHRTFSYAEIDLGPGSYAVTGVLTQSAIYGGMPLNATLGGIQLAAVPVPAALWLFASGVGFIGAARRRAA